MATWTTRVRWVEDGLVLRVTEVELAVGGAAALHHVKAAARRLDEARAADLPPLEDLRREAPADGYALDREPRVALDEEPVALGEGGYVVEPRRLGRRRPAHPGLPDDDDDDDGDADDGGGDPAPARYSRFVVRFSGSVPVVVGTFWRRPRSATGASPNSGSWFGGELRAEDALKATERLRTLPAPGADGLSPDAAARARSGAAARATARALPSVSAASSAGATYAEDAGPARAGDTRVRAPARVADVFRGDLDLDDGADALGAAAGRAPHRRGLDERRRRGARRRGGEAAGRQAARRAARRDGRGSGQGAAEALDAVAVAAITCGVEHSVALERSGHVWTSVAATIYERFGVFTWGLGPAVGRGREGFDRTLADGEDGRPTRVRDLEDVVWLGAGHSFTAALTFAGELYLWGDGDVLGRAAPRHRPARAAFPKGAKCVAAACGLYHVLAMTCARDARP
ncbi:hypothetical protein JL721_9499 [Aureococcus anophagefferens]|nr:hypothetical protein JL721_9499 [Aureococcus anophagefferens]